jgi:hypothetical protein
MNRNAGFAGIPFALFFSSCLFDSAPSPKNQLPEVAAAVDTVVYTLSTFRIVASASDADGEVKGFIWNLDGTVLDTTGDSAWSHVWDVADTGVHWISVTSMDDKQALSEPETVFVNVLSGRPILHLRAIPDAGVGDTLFLKPEIEDPNDDTLSILWSLDGGGQRTSPSSDWRIPIQPQDTGTRTIQAQARDSKGLLSDLESIEFRVLALPPKVKVRVQDTLVRRGDEVALSVSASDTNGTVDSLIARFGDGKHLAQTDSRFSIPWQPDFPDSLWVRFQAKDNHGFLSDKDSSLIRYERVRQIRVYRYGFDGNMPGVNGVELDNGPTAVFLTNNPYTQLSTIHYREESGADLIFESNSTFDSAFITPMNGASVISLPNPDLVISKADIQAAVGQANKTPVAAGGDGSYVFHNGSSIRQDGTGTLLRARAGMAFYVSTASGTITKVRILEVTSGDVEFLIDTDYK